MQQVMNSCSVLYHSKNNSVALHLRILFCLTVVACDVCVSFLSACDVIFGPVLFCTYEEYKPLINLSGSPQRHQRFDVFVTPSCVHVAHGHSTHAEAFTLPKSFRLTILNYCLDAPSLLTLCLTGLSLCALMTHPNSNW